MSDKFKRERVAALPSLAVPATLAKPLWIRAPKKGPEYWTGFSRSKLYELEKDGKIRSVSIRGPGQQKGTRLFELKSILAFIEAQSRSRKKAA